MLDGLVVVVIARVGVAVAFVRIGRSDVDCRWCMIWHGVRNGRRGRVRRGGRADLACRDGSALPSEQYSSRPGASKQPR